MSEARAAGGHTIGAARELSGAARHAAYAAAQAAKVAHVTAHELGAVAYAIKAALAAAPGSEERARLECHWQREQLPDAIRELALHDRPGLLPEHDIFIQQTKLKNTLREWMGEPPHHPQRGLGARRTSAGSDGCE